MKRLHLLLAVFLFTAVAFASRPQAILGPGTGGANFRVPYHEMVNRVLSADTTYIITGWYFVDSTYSITIPAGTLLRGDSASGGTLIISRGAKIFASGTKKLPIIFTSNKPAGTRVPGDWGGVIILGAAPTNKPTTQQIEGGFGTIPNTLAMYGGSDSHDNSGILQYVRIEFAGIAFAQDNEINGLTFGGVGDGTTIDHIQVSFANDDDYEFFGGTLRAKYLVAWRSLDDCYDTDFGFSGSLQFIYDKRDPSIFDASASGSSNGFESDNEANSPFDATPRTKVRMCNATLIGPQNDTNAVVNSHWGNLSMLRRATQLSIYNSVLVGWPKGIAIRDTLTQRACVDDLLQIRNTSINAKAGQAIALSSSPSTGNISGFDVAGWFNGVSPYSATGNIGTTERNPDAPGFVAQAWNLNWTNNPVPSAGSELATAGTSYQGRLAGDAWFDSVSYRGAFDPSKPRDQQWDWGWTNYDPQNYDPEVPVTGQQYDVADGWNMLSLPMKNTVPVATQFPTAASQAFVYQGGYQGVANVSNGAGFWMKFNGAQSLSNVIGVTNLVDTFNVNPRWNMIGALSYPVAVSSIVSIPDTNISSPYYSYNGGYSAAATLEPGKGYWVKAAGTGKLYLNTSSAAPKMTPANELALDKMAQITVVDLNKHSQHLYFGTESINKVSLEKYELPPIPPSGAFDARFTSQRYVEFGKEYSISLQGTYPMTITLSGKDVAGHIFEVDEVQAGKVVARHTILGGTSVAINNSKTTSVLIQTGAANFLPVSFALSQNYPNPFNPTTRMSVEMPKSTEVEVAVYDILGQKIATLLSGQQGAGYHTVEWNGTNQAGLNVPSGTYFIRMISENFTKVQKVMLMK